MKINYILAFMAIMVISTTSAQEQEAPIFGKGLFNLVGKDSSYTMKIAARMQFLAVTNWQDGNSPITNFLVRRARLKFNGFAFSPKLKYKMELGLSNRDIAGASIYNNNTPLYILDAVIKYNFAPGFEFWFGQTKLPGNRERVISSGDLQQVDRSLLNSQFNIDRDIGIQLRHKSKLSDKFVMREILSMAQGEGRNVTIGNIGGHQYTGRLEFLPFGDFTSKGDYSGGDLKREEKPKLSLGVTYDYNSNAVKNRSNRGLYMINDEGFYETDIQTLFIDFMFKHKGFSLMGEYADREAGDPLAKNSDGTLTGDEVQVGKGINLQAGYLLDSDWEISGRYTGIDLDKTITGKDAQNQYTLGVSRYIVGHKLKVQSDISLLQVDNSNDIITYRLQFDIHF